MTGFVPYRHSRSKRGWKCVVLHSFPGQACGLVPRWWNPVALLKLVAR